MRPRLRSVQASARAAEARLAWALATPALAIILVAGLLPIGWTVWESMHVHDLRMPWLGRPFVGFANYTAALRDPRLGGAVARTAFFVATSVSLELLLGLALALGLDALRRGTGVARTALLLPWAVPTVVSALIWRFLFESPGGAASTAVRALGGAPPTWLADPTAAWVPLVVADVWRTTPFVALLVLAALQQIDRGILDAAAVDGAGPWRRFRDVTLPLITPALVVAGLFRVLDACRVFDLVYVLTGGGPGDATEPIALLTFTTLLQHLRFGDGAALATLMFLGVFTLALGTIRVFGRLLFAEPRDR